MRQFKIEGLAVDPAQRGVDVLQAESRLVLYAKQNPQTSMRDVGVQQCAVDVLHAERERNECSDGAEPDAATWRGKRYEIRVPWRGDDAPIAGMWHGRMHVGDRRLPARRRMRLQGGACRCRPPVCVVRE